MPYDGQVSDFVKTNDVADTLRRARAMIDAPEKWCKGAFDAGGRFCMLGAVIRSKPRFEDFAEGIEFVGKCDAALRRASGGWSTMSWNDDADTTHADVMSAFDRAIELAEREGR